MTKERKEYIDSCWKNTLFGEYMLCWPKQEDENCMKRADEIRSILFYKMDPPFMSMDTYNRIFAKDFAKVFKNLKEWDEYTDILFAESAEMKEAMRVSAVTNGFMFMAEEELRKREKKDN